MSFGDVSTDAGLEKFNNFLLDNAYVSGWVPTQADVTLFKSIKSSPDGSLFLFFFGKLGVLSMDFFIILGQNFVRKAYNVSAQKNVRPKQQRK